MREYRTRRKLEEKRHALVQQMLTINPDFKPPSDYKYVYIIFEYHFYIVSVIINQFHFRPPIIRVNDRVMIPQEEHPDINFVGLLIGPRGNTLKCIFYLLIVLTFKNHFYFILYNF